MIVYEKCEYFVMQMLHVCVLCASCGISQCCVLHDLQFVNAGRGCKKRPWSHGCLVCSFIVSNVVIYLYIYCLYAIKVHKCIKFDNFQVKVSG